MSNISGNNGFNQFNPGAKMVYGICRPSEEPSINFIEPKMVYGICTPDDDSVDISSNIPEKFSFFQKIGNFIHNLFKTEK